MTPEHGSKSDAVQGPFRHIRDPHSKPHQLDPPLENARVLSHLGKNSS